MNNIGVYKRNEVGKKYIMKKKKDKCYEKHNDKRISAFNDTFEKKTQSTIKIIT